MENHHSRSNPNRSSTKKPHHNNNGGFTSSVKTANTATTYDDVFGGPPRFGAPSLSPRLEDYCEIFSGFNGSSRAAVSSIPVLDLPLVDGKGAYFDVRRESFDYREVFGGFDDLDLAPSYEELFLQRRRRSSTVADGDSSDDAWTPEEEEEEVESVSGKSPSFSNGRDSYDSIDGCTEFNISYNKASHQMNNISYTVAVDEMVGGASGRGKVVNKETGPSFSSVVAFEDKNGEPFVTVSEIGLKTHPTGIPPPSRPPPVLKSDFRRSGTNGSEGSAEGGSPPFFDVEVDASSAAVREAMVKAEAKLKSAKELFERKREGKSIHAAGLPGSKPLSSQGSVNSDGNEEWEEATQFVEMVRTEQPRNADENSGGEDVSFPLSAGFFDQKLTGAVNGDREDHEAKKLPKQHPGTRKVASKHKRHEDRLAVAEKATQEPKNEKLRDAELQFEIGNNVSDHGGIVKHRTLLRPEENKPYTGEKVAKLKNQDCVFDWEQNARRLREALGLSDNESTLEVSLGMGGEMDESEAKLKEALRRIEEETSSKEARVKEETEAFEKAQHEKRLRAALEQEENERREAEARKKAEEEERKRKEQEEYELRLKEAFEKEEENRRTREAREKAEQERRRKEQEENELRLKEAYEKEEENRRTREAREKAEQERRRKEQEEYEWRLKEAFEKEEKNRRMREAREKAENERKMKVALEQEKERKVKEAREKEENERRIKEAHEKAEVERRMKETLEQEEKERRIKEREAYERRAKEALEQAENERKLKEALEQKEKERRLKEENEKKLKEAIELEEKEKRLIEAFERAETERRLKEELEQEEIRLQEAKETEEKERTRRENQERQEKETKQHKYTREERRGDTCEMEKTCETANEANGEQCSKENLRDTLEENERAHNHEPVNKVLVEEGPSQRVSVSEEAYQWKVFEKNLKDASQQEGTSELDTESVKQNGESGEESASATDNVQGGKLNQKSKTVEERSEDEKVKAGSVGGDQRNLDKSANKASSGFRNHEDTSTQQQERPLPSRVFMQREKEAERLKRELDSKMEHLRKIEEEREREREREKDRMAFDQRALADARERLEKACAEARERSFPDNKASTEARIRAERAAVERATAEARERAAEKAAFEARDRMERSVSDKQFQSSGFFERSASEKQFQNSASFGASRYQNSPGADGESPQRYTSRLERHRRTADRVAKALAEKNMRDLAAQREQAERTRIAETLDAEVKRWSSGKEGNIRALLSTLQYILGSESGWQPLPLTEVITSAAVKRAYRKATLCVHPDKLQQRGANIHQKYICEKVFDLLKEAWNRFNSEER